MPTEKITPADEAARAMSAFDEGVANPNARPAEPPAPDPSEIDGGADDEVDGMTAEEVAAHEKAKGKTPNPDDPNAGADDDTGTPAADTSKDKGEKKFDPATYDPAKAIADKAKARAAEAAKKDKPAEGEGKDAGKDKPAAGDDKGKDGEAGKDGKKLTAEEQAKADQAATDAEAKKLGLKEGSPAHKRFQELANSNRDHERRWKDIGGEDGVRALQTAATDLQQWESHIAQTGATGEQLGQALGFLTAINSKDPAVLNQAFDNMIKEVNALGQRIGRSAGEGSGSAPDPLAEFPEIKAKVEAGKMDREDALAWVRDKKAAAVRAAAVTDRNVADEADQATRRGLGDLATLGQSLRARDGDQVFQAKMALTGKAINIMQRSNPPAKWKELAQELYEAMVVPAAVTPPGTKARTTTSSIRSVPAGGGGNLQRKATDPLDAFDIGVEEARDRGE